MPKKKTRNRERRRPSSAKGRAPKSRKPKRPKAKTGGARSLKKVKRKAAPKKSRRAYIINRDFDLYRELKAILIKASPEDFSKIVAKLKKVRNIKLAVVTGTFLKFSNARIDLLVVGDDIPLQRLTNVIKDIEADMGAEIRYVVLSRAEFSYRREMFDRFLRDILEYPHQKIISRLKIK